MDIALLLKLFNWGKSRQCLYDSAKSFGSIILEGDKESADEVINAWLTDKTPAHIQTTEDARLSRLCLISRLAASIIQEYELKKQQNRGISNRLYLTASRAYAERGNFMEAAQCLHKLIHQAPGAILICPPWLYCSIIA